MSDNKHITKKQHFIPQTFLRGFSIDKNKICRYEIDTKAQQNNIPIKSILYRNSLYEIKNSDGTFCKPNQIENSLKSIEDDFNKYKNRILNSVKNEQNYQTKCFLNEEEKNYWKLYIIVQILRHEYSIDFLKLHFLNCEKKMDEIDAQNSAIMSCLAPFYSYTQDNNKSLDFWWSTLKNMAFLVGYDETGSLFINEKVGSFISTGRDKNGLKEYLYILFPICRHIVLQLCNMDAPENQALKGRRNVLIKLSDSDIEFVKQSIAGYADEVILSASPLTEKDIKIIEEAQEKKKKQESGQYNVIL